MLILYTFRSIRLQAICVVSFFFSIAESTVKFVNGFGCPESMGSREEDLEMGEFYGEPENRDLKSVESRGEMSSDMRGNVLNDDGGGGDTSVVDGALSKVVGLNSKQLRLRRAVSDVRFKAKLAPVHPDKKVRSSAHPAFR